MLRFFFLSLVLTLSIVTGTANAAGILVMGDSLSAGYGIDQSKAWPNLLIQKLQHEGYRYEVHNASISGETTSGGRTRIAEALARTKPQVVILELGANDGLRGLSLKAMRDNLDAMINAAQTSGAKVLLIGMRMPPNLGQAYTDKFHASFDELAKARKTAFLPFFLDGVATKRELIQADGLHPVAAAQPTLLANVWPKLQPLLMR
ncbi:arylesterase [Uliginosibacterium sp. H3]|uniref:Arylesterase n=1 Tax=Uliginosibacterium silvisoli TaxID=3114758 RepID=A0ABU6K479_9RHOO|nr:arylesterase [Uliginosibacterium sp. H3]